MSLALLTAADDRDTLRWAPAFALPDLAAAEAHVRRRARQWATDEWYAWAVCEPVTGEMLAEVGLRDLDRRAGGAELTCWTVPAHRGRGVMRTAARAVLGLALGAAAVGGLGLHRVEYVHAASNAGSARLADRLGFIRDGRLREAALDPVTGEREDLLVHSRLLTDPPVRRA